MTPEEFDRHIAEDPFPDHELIRKALVEREQYRTMLFRFMSAYQLRLNPQLLEDAFIDTKKALEGKEVRA